MSPITVTTYRLLIEKTATPHQVYNQILNTQWPLIYKSILGQKNVQTLIHMKIWYLLI